MDIAELGLKIDSRPAVKAVDDLDDLALAAGRAEMAADDLHASTRRLAPGMAAGGHQSRMMAMQLSQVAQQASATGNWVQALSIQLPDMALGFGAVGIAAGVLASVTLPLLTGWLSNTGAQATATTEALKALTEAQKGTQAEIDKLRLGVAESYQVDLLNEQIRLQGEYNTMLAERTRIAASFGNDERARAQYIADSNVELQKIVDRYDEISNALSGQQNRSAQLVILEGIKAQRAGEIAAKQREVAAETAKVEAQLRAAGISAETLARMNFGNIDQARAYAEGLAGALQAASAYAAELSMTGQSSGPDAARSIVQFGGPVAMQPSGAGMAWTPSSGGGGGGGGGGADDYRDRLAALVENLRTEREIETEWYQENLKILEDRRALEILGQQAHQAALIDLHQEYRNRIAEIDAQAMQSRLADTANLFGALASIAEAGGRKQAKAAATFAAIATTVNGYATAMDAARMAPTLPGKIAAYAAWIGQTAKAVSAIRSAGGIGGGGGLAAQGMTSQPSAPAVEYKIYGLDRNARYTGEEIAQIFDGLVEERNRRGGGGISVTFV